MEYYLSFSPVGTRNIACAIEGKVEYFLTTDDKLLKKFAETKELIVINPVNFIPILESM